MQGNYHVRRLCGMDAHQEHSLGGRVFHTIRGHILSGVYKDGEELREATLGKELGVSRTPVREALRQLELEGLVTIIPNKGAYVTGITQKDVMDIYMIRSLLEGLCARLATERITPKQLSELEEAVLLSEFHVKKASNYGEQITELDGRFHAILYEASDSRILSHLLTDFHRYVQRARQTSLVSEERARKSIREHKQILRAIKEKDGYLAEQLANEHILHVVQNLKKHGYEEREPE